MNRHQIGLRFPLGCSWPKQESYSGDSVSYLPNQLLSRLVGDRMHSVEFVLNDYGQLRFDGTPGAGSPVALNCYVWPLVQRAARLWHEQDVGYGDALRRLTPGTVTSTSEAKGTGIHPAKVRKEYGRRSSLPLQLGIRLAVGQPRRRRRHGWYAAKPPHRARR